MKYIYPLALLLLLASCQEEKKKEKAGRPDRTKTDWSFYRLESNVRSVSEKSYEAVGPGQKGSPRQELASAHDTDLTFNDKGLLVLEKKWLNGNMPYEETTYTGRKDIVSKIQYLNGQPAIKTDYSRDKYGNITAIIRRNGDNTQLDRTAMLYNGKLLAETKTFSNQDNPNGRTTYVYDKKGNLKGENLYLNSEYIQVKNLYEYDAQNRKISETRYSKDKTLYKTVFEYRDGNLVKKETTGPDGVIASTEKSSYDKKGNLLERYIYDGFDKSQIHEMRSYDTNGNMTGNKVTRNDKIEFEALNKYDERNNLVKTQTANGAGQIYDSRVYSYDYDSKGNWIKKTVYINDKPSIIIERAISYLEIE
ncbi:hypothetical protein [uncultured Flavobacterium sp.]|uniref:hypothetical protein n=1 Tax=uncultured Flavobacterium sp. TaxID=165435 RepID=UPI0025D8E6A3|nr:hypothetical protein [uncultured Flavobacterium sp.]